MNALPSGPLVRIIPPGIQFVKNNFPQFFAPKKCYLPVLPYQQKKRIRKDTLLYYNELILIAS